MKYLFISILFFIFLSSCSNSSNSIDDKSMDTAKNTKLGNANLEEKIKPLNNVPTVKIGEQEWMTEDIKTTVYNNGDAIFEAKTENKWVSYGAKKEGCYRKLDNGTYVYNGFAVNDKRGIIPSGFALPSHEQFKKLIHYLGSGDSQTGKATRSLATYSIIVEEWVGEGEDGGLEDVKIKSNGKSGFNAKRGGFVYDQGGLGNEGNCSYWWTSSKIGEGAEVVDIGYCSQDLGGGEGAYSFNFGFAVRGIKSK